MYIKYQLGAESEGKTRTFRNNYRNYRPNFPFQNMFVLFVCLSSLIILKFGKLVNEIVQLKCTKIKKIIKFNNAQSKVTPNLQCTLISVFSEKRR